VLNFPTSGQHPERILADGETGLAAGIEKMAVTVSFDGGSTTHDRLRGKRGAFATATRAFKGLRDLAGCSGRRLHVHPGLTLSGELLRLAPEPLDDLARDLGLNGIEEIHVNLAHRSDHYYANAGIAPLPVERIARTLDRALRARQRNGRKGVDWSLNLLERIYLGYGRNFIRTGKPPLACKALSASVFIDAGLDVYPCTVFPRRLGNLKEHGFDLRALRNGPEWRAARSLVARGACPGCWTPCEAYTAILGRLLGLQGPRVLGAAFTGAEFAGEDTGSAP
jgi:MoaA/NifB/PqqE/SkfB family radical SAM enzyme